MVGLWVPVNGRPMGNKNKTFSGGTEGNGDGGTGGWENGGDLLRRSGGH